MDTEVVKAEEITWHFWIANAITGENMKHPVLCWFTTGSPPPPDVTGSMSVTMLKPDVTCQECLEVLHA